MDPDPGGERKVRGSRGDHFHLCKPFVDADCTPAEWPLARYLPVIPANLITNWLSSRSLPPGSTVLDPFGTSPLLVLELASAGYRVVTCMFNPVVRMLFTMGIKTYYEKEVRSALEALAGSNKEGRRFDDYILSLYQARCAVCGKELPASEYTWERDIKLPQMVVLDCPVCGVKQEQVAGRFDLQVFDNISTSPLYRSLAIERITGGEAVLKEDARSLVEAYTPRALFVIVSILTKIDRLQLTTDQRRILQLLLLAVLDEGNTLWPLDNPEYRPLQVQTPGRFIEKNLWYSLQRAAGFFGVSGKRLQIISDPVLPEDGEITVFPDRVKDLLARNHRLQFDAVVTAIPRPNQAFWKLSAAWSAWLSGLEVDRSFVRMLLRDRYDWKWNAAALESVFLLIRQSGIEAGRWFSVLSDLEPAFLSSVIPAAAKSGWMLDSFSMHPEKKLAELEWIPGKPVNKSHESVLDKCKRGVELYLQKKGEPAGYMEITASGLLHTDFCGMYLDEREGVSIQSQLRSAINSDSRFVHLGSGSQTQESGLWWLEHPPQGDMVLSDAIETEVLRLLNLNQVITRKEMEEDCRLAFPWALSGREEYIEYLLKNYAEPVEVAVDTWRMKKKEKEDQRKPGVEKLRRNILDLGVKLGYEVTDAHPLLWSPQDGAISYRFFIYTHTAFAGELWHRDYSGGENILVIPASRLDLLDYKQKNMHAISDLLAGGWHIVKFRLMARLVENPYVNREKFAELLKTDPVETNPDQLFLF